MAKEVTKEFSLYPEEAVIKRVDKIGYGYPISTKTNELVLTSTALIHIKKSILGKTKEVVRYPLADILTSGGKPQVQLGKIDNITPALDVYLAYGTERFRFTWDNEVEDWIIAITEAVTGEKIERKDPMDVFSDLLQFAESVADVTTHVRKAFGIKETEQVAGKCSACGASITGIRGESIKCPFCDTYTVL